MNRKIVKLIILIIWMGVIFALSNQKAEDSSKLSRSFIFKVTKIVTFNRINENTQDEIAKKYVNIVRKTAHAFIYFVLSLIAFSFLKEFFGISYKTLFFTILFCLLYSISDEIHQLFIPGRSGEIRDVMIDTTSATLTALLNYKIRKICKKK